MKFMGALKGLVIGMGFLIVAGLAALGYGLYIKTGGLGVTPKVSGLSSPALSSPAKPFGDITVPMPAGCAIVQMKSEGDRLYLRIGPAGSCARVIVFDIAQGRVLGTLRVGP